MENRESIHDTMLQSLTDAISGLPGVEAVFCPQRQDVDAETEMPEYRLLIYTSEEVPLLQRRDASLPFTQYLEQNTGGRSGMDSCLLKESGTRVNLQYRDFAEIKYLLHELLEEYRPHGRDATVLWYNILTATILYDKSGGAKRLQERYRQSYPEELKKGIIERNYPLLRESLASLENRIEKAILMKDPVEITRTAASFLSTYFEILFALNELPQPDRMNLIHYLMEEGEILPVNMESDIRQFIESLAGADMLILERLNLIIDRLEDVLDGYRPSGG